MTKRIVLCLLIFCLLLIFSSCLADAEETTPPTPAMTDGGDFIGDKNSPEYITTCDSFTFLHLHYGVTLEQAEEYARYKADLENGLFGSDVANERLEALINKKYQTQPLTDKGLKSIELNAMPQTLWNMALKAGSDIVIKNVGITFPDSRYNIPYKVDLLINNNPYEVNGTLTFVNVDDKWIIDNVDETGWTPELPL